jgi:hypothetical protein
MKFKMMSVFLAAVLAFAMAPAHAGNGNSNSNANSNSNKGSGPSEQGKKHGQGHKKYASGELNGKGVGHAKHNDVSDC